MHQQQSDTTLNKVTSYIFVKAAPDESSDRVTQLIAKDMQPLGSPVMISKTMVGQAPVGYPQMPQSDETPKRRET